MREFLSLVAVVGTLYVFAAFALSQGLKETTKPLRCPAGSSEINLSDYGVYKRFCAVKPEDGP